MCYQNGSIEQMTSTCPMCKLLRPTAARCAEGSLPATDWPAPSDMIYADVPISSRPVVTRRITPAWTSSVSVTLRVRISATLWPHSPPDSCRLSCSPNLQWLWLLQGLFHRFSPCGCRTRLLTLSAPSGPTRLAIPQPAGIVAGQDAAAHPRRRSTGTSLRWTGMPSVSSTASPSRQKSRRCWTHSRAPTVLP